MNLWGLFNCNFSFGLNNWFTPQNSYVKFPQLNFSYPRIFIPNIFSFSAYTHSCSSINFGNNYSFPFIPLQRPALNLFPATFQQKKTTAPSTTSENQTEEISLLTFTKKDKPKTNNKASTKSIKKTKNTNNNKKQVQQGNVSHRYLQWSKNEAEQHAKRDKNLEHLNGGRNWSVANTFFTDIPYAKKGTSIILDKVASILGEKLVITSAVGTGEPNTPHIKYNGYKSHHNAENPKLDIRTNGNANAFAARLKSTGYFSHVLAEGDHIDVQIDPAKYRELNIQA